MAATCAASPNATPSSATACRCRSAVLHRSTNCCCTRRGQFMDAHGIQLYTEHLSYCSDDGHLYDLLPIPFTEEAVHYVAARIRRAQDILERRIAIENASYYTPAPIAEMDELAFIRAVLHRGRLRPASRRQQRLCQQREPPLRSARIHPRAADRAHRLPAHGRALHRGRRPAGRHPRRRRDRSGVDAARRRPTASTASRRRCWSATSTFRR